MGKLQACFMVIILQTINLCEAACCPFTPKSSGGNLFVTSSSSAPPTGITIISDNVYEGSLVVGGDLPLLGSVALEGEIGTAGAASISYDCGDEVVLVSSPVVAEIPAGIITPGVVEIPAIMLPTAMPFGVCIGKCGYRYPGYLSLGYGLGCPGYYAGFRGYGYGL